MAEKKYFWLKMPRNFFEKHYIKILRARNLMPYELMRSRSVSINGPVNQTLLSLISARSLTIYTSMP